MEGRKEKQIALEKGASGLYRKAGKIGGSSAHTQFCFIASNNAENHIVVMESKGVLMEGNKSKKAVQTKHGEQPRLARRISLRNKSATQDRKNRVITSMQYQEKDIAPGKNGINCLPEAGQQNPGCMQSAEGLKIKHRCSLINLGVQEKVKNISKKNGSLVVGLEFQNVTRALQKTSSSSDLKKGPLKKTWNLRSRTKLIQPEKKTCGNHVEGQSPKSRSLSILEHSVHNINCWKCRKRKGGISCYKSQLHSPENLRRNVEERSPSSITHLSRENCKEERELIAKSSRSTLVKSKKPEIKTKNSVAVTTSKMPDGVEAREQNNPCFLECASNCEGTKKFQGTTEEGIHMTVTQAFLKSNMCKNDGVQSSVVSNRQHGKLAEIDKDWNVQNLLEQSTCLPVPKSDKTENSDCVNLCFGREIAVYRGAISNPIKDVKCPQLLDIKIIGGKVENNTLAVCQDAKRTWLAKCCDLPCSIERFPIVRLLDCCYIKSLLNPGVKSIKSYKVHFGSLNVASSQGKVLPSSRDMGQNDSSNSPNLLQTGEFLPEESILVRKEMCQNSNRSSRCQNGKPFRERKQRVDFEQPSKKIKTQRDLEKLAIQKVPTNVNIHSECGLQMEDKFDTKTFGGKLNCNETTCLSSLEHRTDFLLEQPPQRPRNQLVSLSCNEKVSKAHVITCDSSDIEKSQVLRKQQNVPEIKSMEPQINIDKKKKYDLSSVNMLGSEKMVSSNSSIGCSTKAKRIRKDKTSCKAKKNLQAYSCQRVVPVSGKNVWPRESCARTSVWIHKNHACDLEITFLRSADLLVQSEQEELHKPLIGTTKTLVDMVIDHKAELRVESCTSGPSFHVDKTFSAIENESRFSSVDRPNGCPPEAKTRKKLKVSLDSLAKDVKNKRSIAKRSISIGVQNDGFSNGKSKTNEQKKSVTKQEILLQAIPRNLSDFKIPLLKNKNEYGKTEYCRSSERNTFCRLDILEDAAISRNKTRAEQTSSDERSKFHFQSEQMNISISKEHANQFDSDYPKRLYKESNEHMETSNESELKTSTLDNNFDPFSTDFKEIQIRETKDKSNSSHLAQDRDSYGEILQAYDDDVLVIDVIQDDPDLFGDTGEQETACTKDHHTETNFNTNIYSEQKLKSEPESPQLLKYRYLKIGSRENPVQDYKRLESVADLLSAEVDEIKSESASEISSIEGVTVPAFEDVQLTVLDDVTRSGITDAKYKFPERMLAVKEEKANIWNIAKIENTQCFEHVRHDHHLELPLPAMKATDPQWPSTAVEPWMNDFGFSIKDPLVPTSYPNSQDSWKTDKNEMTNLGLLYIPRGYCRYHFNTLKGCEKENCRFHHHPPAGNEKFCSAVLKKYLSIGEVVLLQRAVQIFTDYCKRSISRLYLNSHIFNDLLASLLQSCLLKELFLVVHTGIMIKLLPSVHFLLKVFEQVASMKLKDTVPDLIGISCKLFDAGMTLEYEHICCITKFLNQLQVSSNEITTFMSRFQERDFKKASLCDFDSAVAEFQHCKEKGDWAKLGTLYINVRRGCGNVDEKYSVYIANILTSVLKEEMLRIPFCEFAAAVNADAQHSEADKHLLGRIGISVMLSYYKKQQWSKAKKILDALHALQIPFTVLKGLLGYERLASRCHIINVAVDIFLKCGCIDGAIWVLKESDWVINTLSWPCDRMDVLTRHNLLCTMASEYITKSQYGKAFEVLKNLPGFQNSCDTLDVSQYSLLFNKLLSACLENKHLEISSAVVDFMLAKNIPVEFNLLRELITTLGRNCLWLKARTHYKSALGLGCYPPLEGNLYRKLLLIPSYMTEVEMLLAIEIFLVANASSIQNLGSSSQLLQIVLKRCEANNEHKEDDYQNAIRRLIKAACISTPKLFIKYLTVNIKKEQVYSLEYASVLNWLKENMKWAGKVWLF